MTFGDFLRWEDSSLDTIAVKRTYVDMAGDLTAGVVLSQIVYWYLPSKRDGATKLRVEHNGVLWIAKARDDWWGECRVSARQMDRVVLILVERGLIETARFKFNGTPTLHVRLLEDNFLAAWQEQIDASGFNESVKSISPFGNPTSPIRKVHSTPAANVRTESTTKSTSKKTTATAPVVVSDKSSVSPAPDTATLTAQLEGLRIEAGAAQYLATAFADRAALVVSYLAANAPAASKVRGGGGVRSMIEHPEKWPQVAAWAAARDEMPRQAKPRKTSPDATARLQRAANALLAHWEANGKAAYVATLQDEGKGLEYLQQFHGDELGKFLE